MRGYLRRHAAGSYVLESPALLALGLRVDAAGVDLRDAIRAVEILRKRLGRAADEIVRHFERRAQSDDALEASDVARTVGALRSVAGDAVRVLFAREIERSLAELVGRAAVPRRRKRRR